VDHAFSPCIRARRAVTLIEAVLFIAVALSLIVGGLVFFQQARTSLQTQQMVRLTQSIVAESRALFNRTDFDELTEVESILIASGAVPPSAVGTHTQNNFTSKYVGTPWVGIDEYGSLFGEFNISAGPFEDLTFVDRIESDGIDNSGLHIFIWNIPKNVCTRIAHFEPDGTGPLGTNIAGVWVGDRRRWAVSQRVFDEVSDHSNIDSVGLSRGLASEWCKEVSRSGNLWTLSVYYFWDG